MWIICRTNISWSQFCEYLCFHFMHSAKWVLLNKYEYTYLLASPFFVIIIFWEAISIIPFLWKVVQRIWLLLILHIVFLFTFIDNNKQKLTLWNERWLPSSLQLLCITHLENNLAPYFYLLIYCSMIQSAIWKLHLETCYRTIEKVMC